ncbi:MAG: hypothetical protein JW924_05205 [Fusobacteriaceae bacterium]|nr:hypothetical protein [Fusobacteriaceae bacterium]
MINENETILLFYLRNSRIKAKRAAIMEVYLVLKDYGGVFMFNGVLNHVKGIFSFRVPSYNLNAIHRVVQNFGYVRGIYEADFKTSISQNNTNLNLNSELIWKKNKFSLNVFYEFNPTEFRLRAPDKRKFKILDWNGNVKEVSGYRGDGTDISKRALPAEDARLLLNLSAPKRNERLLDPFVGGGGIIYEARDSGYSLDLYSSDIDPILKPGLEMLGSKHVTSNIIDLNFDDEFFDIICTETPFSGNANKEIILGLSNLYRILNRNGRLVMMCSELQEKIISKKTNELGIHKYFSMLINRKGTSVYIMAFKKGQCDEYIEFFQSLDIVY